MKVKFNSLEGYSRDRQTARNDSQTEPCADACTCVYYASIDMRTHVCTCHMRTRSHHAHACSSHCRCTGSPCPVRPRAPPHPPGEPGQVGASRGERRRQAGRAHAPDLTHQWQSRWLRAPPFPRPLARQCPLVTTRRQGPSACSPSPAPPGPRPRDPANAGRLPWTCRSRLQPPFPAARPEASALPSLGPQAPSPRIPRSSRLSS